MVLIGLHTRSRTERQWSLLARLGGHFLDVVEGLPTLKVFGRAKAQAATVRRVTDEHRRATMATLRVAFLSAFALELLATLATALVAVEVGLRLLAGTLGYETALLVLLLAPEAYLPLRNVGPQFHASMEGVVAAEQALDVIDVEIPPRVGGGAVDLRRDEIRLERVGLRYAGRADAALRDVDLVIRPGEHVALVGGSGAGKSSLIALLLGFERPTTGGISIGGAPIETVDLEALRHQIAWVPQRAHLFAGTVADNIRLGCPDADDVAVRRAADLAGVTSFTATLPLGLDAPVGERGLQLCCGQRQRVAVARALLRDAPLLLLDEPTAHLDDESAAQLQEVLTTTLAGARTVLVVSHVHGWTGRADRVLRVASGRVDEPEQVLAS
jgi:ATP-binding cassette subfamily C protein CydD